MTYLPTGQEHYARNTSTTLWLKAQGIQITKKAQSVPCSVIEQDSAAGEFLDGEGQAPGGGLGQHPGAEDPPNAE